MMAFFSRPRLPLLGLALAAVAGIALADQWPPPLGLMVPTVLALALLVWRTGGPWLCRIWVALAFAAVHLLRVHHGPEAAMARVVETRAHPVEIEGVVWSEPVSFTSGRGEPLANFVLRTDAVQLGEARITSHLLCSVRWLGTAPVYGDRVRLRGQAEALPPPRNPGEFDSAAWQRRRGVAFTVQLWSRADGAILAHGQGHWAERFAIASRAWVKRKLEIGHEGASEAALIESMVLGLRGETPVEMKELFQKTGTLHLFAVSGLNVAMLAIIVATLLKPLRFSRAAAACVAVPLLLGYAIITGFGPSCARATVMALFVLAAPMVSRPAVLMNSMGGAALTILAWDTNQLFLPGFQLSFVLVLCILALADPLTRWMTPWLQPDDFIPRPLWSRWQRVRVAGWRFLCGVGGATLAAWLGSLLFMVGYFHLLSPVAIVANAIAVPIAFAVLALGLFGLLVSLTPLLAVVNAANWACAKLLLWSIGLFAQVPYGHVYVEWPALRHRPACELTVLDVGEGAAIHVRADGEDWMLDAGHPRDYARVILPYLRSRGVNQLEGLFLTHGDSAHSGGALELIEDFHPRWIADSPLLDRSPIRRTLHAGLAAKGIGRRFLQRGDVCHLSPHAALTVLYPPVGLDRSAADDKALVCRLEVAGRRVLLASDAGFFTEQWLLANEPDLRADVLVKGWHARDFSGTSDFLLRVQPQAIVCSSLEFGQPPEKFATWAQPITARGIALFPQQHCSAVKIAVSKDGDLEVRGWKQ